MTCSDTEGDFVVNPRKIDGKGEYTGAGFMAPMHPSALSEKLLLSMEHMKKWEKDKDTHCIRSFMFTG